MADRAWRPLIVTPHLVTQVAKLAGIVPPTGIVKPFVSSISRSSSPPTGCLTSSDVSLPGGNAIEPEPGTTFTTSSASTSTRSPPTVRWVLVS